LNLEPLVARGVTKAVSIANHAKYLRCYCRSLTHPFAAQRPLGSLAEWPLGRTAGVLRFRLSLERLTNNHACGLLLFFGRPKAKPPVLPAQDAGTRPGFPASADLPAPKLARCLDGDRSLPPRRFVVHQSMRIRQGGTEIPHWSCDPRPAAHEAKIMRVEQASREQQRIIGREESQSVVQRPQSLRKDQGQCPRPR
jgi:hypothetical protein